MTKLLVWDFDGTLADTRALIETGMDACLRDLGLQDRPDLRAEWLKYVGLPVEEGVRRTFGPEGISVAEVLQAYRKFDWVGHESLICPFPGMSELVWELRGLGVKMAIASSKRSVALRRQLAAFHWEGCFDPIITPDEVQWGKPHPESLEQCCRCHGLEPGDLLMIGDTPFDLEMAQRASVPSVAVGHGYYGEDALRSYGPVAFAADTAALRRALLERVQA